MNAVKLSEAEKGTTLAEMIHCAYMAGVTEDEIKEWLRCAIGIHKKQVHTIITQRDFKNANKLYIKGLKA